MTGQNAAAALECLKDIKKAIKKNYPSLRRLRLPGEMNFRICHDLRTAIENIDGHLKALQKIANKEYRVNSRDNTGCKIVTTVEAVNLNALAAILANDYGLGRVRTFRALKKIALKKGISFHIVQMVRKGNTRQAGQVWET